MKKRLLYLYLKSGDYSEIIAFLQMYEKVDFQKKDTGVLIAAADMDFSLLEFKLLRELIMEELLLDFVGLYVPIDFDIPVEELLSGFQKLGNQVYDIAKFITDLVKRLLIAFQLTLHAVELGLGAVEGDHPLLGAAVVLAKRIRRILQSRAQRFNFAFLRINLLGQHFIFSSEGLHTALVFIKLRGGQLHFRAEHLELLIDVGKRLFEFLFALYTQPNAEMICHATTPS